MVKVIISEDSSEYLLYILISISAAILLGWIFFAIYKTRALRSQNLVIPDAAINLDFINQNFPKLAYKARKGGDESVECSICLESFRKADMIRQLSCTHIFHAKCIELWFQRNTVCCLCKRDYKDITTEAEESRVEDTRSANATSWIIEDLDNPTINSSHEETTFRNQNFDFNN